MAKVYIYSADICNTAASHHVETGRALKSEAKGLHRRTEANLAAARASSTSGGKIWGIDHQTNVVRNKADIDWHVSLQGPGAISIEFGHKPSGFFADTATTPPAGLYIISRAALGG